jgi:hypothetical protein
MCPAARMTLATNIAEAGAWVRKQVNSDGTVFWDGELRVLSTHKRPQHLTRVVQDNKIRIRAFR